MASQERDKLIDKLSKAYRSNNLTLYLGAGVSLGNGLPSWEKLVLAMYFSAIKRADIVEAIRPFPNYLFAIAEWHLERRREPLDITARKIRNLYKNEEVFLDKLHETLYAGFLALGNRTTPDLQTLLLANPTLKAVANLCTKDSSSNRRPIQSVISYNYDNLLELATEEAQVLPIWRANQRLKRGVLPIYHVHGYIPIEGSRSRPNEVVFTEEQYYLAAQNAYSWSNLIQIRHLSSSVGLMIGLSLTDRNMRRLLDALKRTPHPPENYVLLQRPQWPKPEKDDLKRVDANAKIYFNRFARSGRKPGTKKYRQIKEIIEGVEESDFYEQQLVLNELGVRAIWYQDHDEIPAIIDRIAD
jgi:hypothetical protein